MFSLLNSQGLSSMELFIRIIAKVMIILLVFPIREFARAWTANKLGDDSALHSGRLTLNPLSHVDPIGALFMLVVGFGWGKPVPINPRNFKNQRKGIAITALAGPVSNLLVALVALIGYRFAIHTDLYIKWLIEYTTGENSLIYLFVMFNYFIQLNIFLAVFSLLPIPPLDGSKILSYFTSYKFDMMLKDYEQYINIGFLVLVFSRLLSKPIEFLSDKVYDLLYLLTNWIDLI